MTQIPKGPDKVTRLEIVDHRKEAREFGLGRVFVHWDENSKIELSLQDNERTLKIFITERGLNLSEG